MKGKAVVVGLLASLVLCGACQGATERLILIGEGVLPADAAWSPDTLAFGRIPVGVGRDLNAWLCNVGGDTLRATIGLPSQCEADYTIMAGAGLRVIAPGDSAQVTLRYTPQAPGMDPCEARATW